MGTVGDSGRDHLVIGTQAGITVGQDTKPAVACRHSEEERPIIVTQARISVGQETIPTVTSQHSQLGNEYGERVPVAAKSSAQSDRTGQSIGSVEVQPSIFTVGAIDGGAEDGAGEQKDDPIVENKSGKSQTRERPDPPTGDSVNRSGEVSGDVSDGSAGEGGDLIARTARVFIAKTIEVDAEHLARVAAHLAGVGPEFEICVVIYRFVEWAQVVQGDGGVEVATPLLLGPGVDVDVSLRIGGDGDEPPLAMYLGPTGDTPVGVLVFHALTVEPAPDHRDRKRGQHEPAEHLKVPPREDEELKHRDASDLAAEQDEWARVEVASVDAAVARMSGSLDGQPYRGVVAVSVDLSQMLPVASQVMTHQDRDTTAAVTPSANESLGAELWEHRQILLNEGVDLIFGYDPKTRRAVLVHVSDESRPPRRVFIGLDALGHLNINVIDATYRSPEVG